MGYLMATSELSRSTAEKEEFDGFFSNSAFRSGYFITATLVCFGTLAYEGFVLYRHWRVLSDTEVISFLFVASLVLGLWTFSLEQHSWTRILLRNETISEVSQDFVFKNVLQVAAKTINNMLFSSSLAVLILLFFVDMLLSRLPAK
jgi:hypothetical protein